jgi:hypothetical protein
MSLAKGAQQVFITSKTPFMMYPINKQNAYSYFRNSPEINFEFANNLQRTIKSNSLRLVGKKRITMQNGNVNLPANRVDVISNDINDVIEDHETIVYINERIGTNSFLANVSVGTTDGGLYEQCRYYNRVMANTMPMHNSYQDLCSAGGFVYTCFPNNDHMNRQCSSDIEFSLQLTCGYLQTGEQITLDRGLTIKIDLAPDAQVLLGASASEFYYELYDLALVGDYLNLSAPMKSNGARYVSYQSFSNVINSNNTHQNVPMALSQVSTIFQSYIPSSWTNNPAYDAFSLCKMMNESTDAEDHGYSVKNGIAIITFNKGNIRYPLTYEVDERIMNAQSAFQTVRSREFLNAVQPYFSNQNTLIAPETEVVPGMVSPRTNWLKTPQYADGGLLQRWTKENGEFKRNGNIESSKYIYGFGAKQDRLNVGADANYANSTFNYSLQSDLDNTSTQVYVFAVGTTVVQASASGQVMSMN